MATLCRTTCEAVHCLSPRAHAKGHVVHQRRVARRLGLLHERPQPLLLQPLARVGERAALPKVIAYGRADYTTGPKPLQPRVQRGAVLDVVRRESADADHRIE
eukprot:CAMPEP_0196702860 /NCGR_PEP_ID=MMETSP1090-20130531/54622_1 /TAXON_ID=37098 /ORGANISM="Isochrysis sp, Strain CCMP1244" /LENGTH=102 /DNA_ID=CAMNT_0042042697 /DNA_START=81 /DNA_END=389 /DNA_ORIENTATION=+